VEAFGELTAAPFQLDLRLKSEKGDTSTYILNGEWALIGIGGIPIGTTGTIRCMGHSWVSMALIGAAHS
jgi:hypothetical protein